MSKKQNTAINVGATFETRMSMWPFVNGYTQGLTDYKLESEVEGTDKFDDVVFDDGSGNYQMIQLKHKKYEEIDPTKSKNPKNTENNTQNEQPGPSTSQQEGKLVKQVIKVADLFNERYNTNYNLIKYVKDYNFANSTERFKDKIKAAVVFTNIGFSLTDDELSLKFCPSKFARVWFAGIDAIKLTPIEPDPAAIYNMTNVAPDAKYFKFNDDPNIVQILMRQAVTLAKDVGTINEDEIREALDKIIYAVEQPNVQKLPDIIKDEIKDYFKLTDVDTIYEKLETYFRDWCENKKLFGQLSTCGLSNTSKQPVLTYNDAHKFFQKYIKQVSFDVTAPTAAFVGRIEELEKIREQLNKKSNIIISQSVSIRGLGGIGKTQLAKQFIKQFGQSDFYGRIIWIKAENDETTMNSFKKLAQLLNIQDFWNKDTKVLIHEVFQYFAGFKVLFVFDNFDKSPVNKAILVTYCCEIASGLTGNGRPYFLFTSRNRDCLPGIETLDLDVLSLEEAVELVQNELPDVNLTRADAEKLVVLLQYFPLALRQAVAYIKQQHTIKQEFGKRYDVQAYFKNFDSKTKDLLTCEFPDDFKKIEKTTYITWDVSLDAIKADKIHGNNAIKALNIFAYLYPDKIDSKIFLPLFENNDEKTARALLLLEKYSMITKVQQKSINFYQIHRLVQAVIQLKVKRNEKDILQQSFVLINYNSDKYFLRYYNTSVLWWIDKWFNMFRSSKPILFSLNLHIDQLLHNNTLSVHMQKHETFKRKYESFFSDLNYVTLLEAALYDNIEKLIALEVTSEELKRLIDRHIERLIKNKSNRVIKYFIEKGALQTNAQVNGISLIKFSQKAENGEIFKFLIDKGADFMECLQCIPLNVFSDIKNGNIDSLTNLIRDKPHDTEKILIDFGIILLFCENDSMIHSIVQNATRPFDTINILINSAIVFGSVNLIKALAPYCNKEQLMECMIKVLKTKDFDNWEIFKIIFNTYLEKGGDVNYQDFYQKSLLNHATENLENKVEKLEIIHFLLDNGVNPFLIDKNCTNAVMNLLQVLGMVNISVDIKRRIDEILCQKIFHNFTPDKFINTTVTVVFRISNWSSKEYFRNLFEKMMREVGDINVRNEEGETVLIKYLKCEWFEIEMVKYLVENGIDIETQDNQGKSALYYAAILCNRFGIFDYLLTRTKSVGENVLKHAISYDKSNIVIKLLENHFSADHRFANGKTLIEVAVENVSPKVILLWKDEFKKYLERGGNVNVQDKEGQTLLIKLTRCLGNTDDIKFFVEHGIDIDLKDFCGKTALFYAYERYNQQLQMYLLEKSNFVDENILLNAIYKGELSIIESLIPQYFKKDYRFQQCENLTPLEVATLVNENHSSLGLPFKPLHITDVIFYLKHPRIYSFTKAIANFF